MLAFDGHRRRCVPDFSPFNDTASSARWLHCAGGRSLGDLKDYVLAQKTKLLAETVA